MYFDDGFNISLIPLTLCNLCSVSVHKLHCTLSLVHALFTWNINNGHEFVLFMIRPWFYPLLARLTYRPLLWCISKWHIWQPTSSLIEEGFRSAMLLNYSVSIADRNPWQAKMNCFIYHTCMVGFFLSHKLLTIYGKLLVLSTNNHMATYFESSALTVIAIYIFYYVSTVRLVYWDEERFESTRFVTYSVYWKLCYTILLYTCQLNNLIIFFSLLAYFVNLKQWNTQHNLTCNNVKQILTFQM